MTNSTTSQIQNQYADADDKESSKQGHKSKFAKRMSRYGNAICSNAKGDAIFYSLPHSLEENERYLGLKPLEAWLLKKMLLHVTNWGGLSFISLRKVERDCDISHASVLKLAHKLEGKGLIKERYRGDPRNPLKDHRVRYDVSNTWRALFYCVRLNPASKFNMSESAGKIPSLEKVRRIAKHYGFSLNWDELEKLTEGSVFTSTRWNLTKEEQDRSDRLKEAIKESFAIDPRWYSRRNHHALRDLVLNGATPDDVVELANGWNGDESPSVREIADRVLNDIALRQFVPECQVVTQ